MVRFLEVLCVLIATAGVAAAQSQDAEALIREGVALRQAHRDAAALPFFEKAYRLTRTPRTAAQLGLVQMALGYWLDADRYLDEALGAPEHPWIAGNLATLRETSAIVKGMIGEISVTCEPSGAEIFVNGRGVGRLPLSGPIRLGKGKADVAIVLSGFVSQSRSVNIAGGSHYRIEFGYLQKTPASVPGIQSSPRNPAPDAEARREATLGEAPANSGNWTRPLAWATSATAVAALTMGIVETVVANNRQDEFNNHTVPTPTATEPNRRTFDCTTAQLTDECRQIGDAHDRARNLAIAGYTIGGAFAITSVLLFVLSTDRGKEHASKETALACAVDPRAPLFSCRIGF